MKLLSSATVVCITLMASTPSLGQNFVLQSSVIGSGAVNGSSEHFKLQGTVGQAAIGTGTSEHFKGSWGFWYTLSAAGGTGGGFFATLGVLLEGAYAGGGMMNAGLGSDLALNQPFSGAPWNYPGTESVASDFATSNPDIVDWVYVQVRDTMPGPASPPMDSLASRAGFVKTDGTIVDTNGVGPLAFPTLAPGTYYIVVDHRNHIRAMSATGVAHVNDTLNYDFSDDVAKAYTTGAPRMKSLSGGFAGLFAGDPSHDQQVTVSDFNVWLTQTKASDTGYVSGDFNVDSQVIASDFNLWLQNTKAAVMGEVPNP